MRLLHHLRSIWACYWGRHPSWHRLRKGLYQCTYCGCRRSSIAS